MFLRSIDYQSDQSNTDYWDMFFIARNDNSKKKDLVYQLAHKLQADLESGLWKHYNTTLFTCRFDRYKGKW